MKLVAMEEAAILDMLWTLLPPEIQLPPLQQSPLPKHELVCLAQSALTPPAFERMLQLLDDLAVELTGATNVHYPEPFYVDPQRSTEAEAIADSHLCEATGSLWSAARETVRSLPFQADPRPIAGGKCINFGLYNKGGLVGITRDTRSHMAVCRLLGAAILAIKPTHQWTTITVGLENSTCIHLDRGNSEFHPSLLVGLTHHSGGELWMQDAAGTVYMDANEQGLVSGLALPCAVLFNGRQHQHCTLPWKLGQRCVLIAYTVAQHQAAAMDHLALLQEAGFVPPSRTSGRAIPL